MQYSNLSNSWSFNNSVEVSQIIIFYATFTFQGLSLGPTLLLYTYLLIIAHWVAVTIIAWDKMYQCIGRVGAVVIDRWCNWSQVLLNFIVILLLYSLWFIWNNCICQIPIGYTSMISNIRNWSTPILYSQFNLHFVV